MNHSAHQINQGLWQEEHLDAMMVSKRMPVHTHTHAIAVKASA